MNRRFTGFFISFSAVLFLGLLSAPALAITETGFMCPDGSVAITETGFMCDPTAWAATTVPTVDCTGAGLPYVTPTTAFEYQSTWSTGASTITAYALPDVLGDDVYTPSLRGHITRGSDQVAHEWISLWWQAADGTWQNLGRARTDGEGRYNITLPSSHGLPIGTHHVFATLEGDQTCAAQRLHIWPDKTEVVVMSLDGLLNGATRSGMSQMLNTWAGLDYRVVYLTGYSYGEDDTGALRQWLTNQGYPEGALVTPATAGPGDDHVFKKARLVEMSEGLDLKIAAAYADKADDGLAFINGGALATQTYADAVHGGVLVTPPMLGDYGVHTSTTVAPQPAAGLPSCSCL